MIILNGHPSEDLVNELIEKAVKARKRSYAPYSKFMVGAALMTADNEIFVGANMEEAAYEALHAERSALSAMNMAGYRNPKLIVCVGAPEQVDNPIVGLAPCGHCRQDLKEFSSLSGTPVQVVISNPDDGDRLYIATIEELLPFAFGPSDIGVDLERHRR